VAQNPGRPERALLQQLMVNRDHHGGSTL
jgi:hypothetical protein